MVSINKLKLNNGNEIHFEEREIFNLIRDLDEKSCDKTFDNLEFAQKMMDADIEDPNNLAACNSKLQQRLLNLSLGYQYISSGKDIDKEHLRELYSILSNNLLGDYDKLNMGKYYRTKPVYFTRGIYSEDKKLMGVDAPQIESCMNSLFEFIDRSLSTSGVDAFIRSQIINSYLFFVHPYFDINRRTSRTLATWYLLNIEEYQYVSFLRAIRYNPGKYKKNLFEGINSGNITHFLRRMLKLVLEELEKERVIRNIKDNISLELSSDEIRIINFFLSIKSNITIKDLMIYYRRLNPNLSSDRIYEDKIIPLIEKGIILMKEMTNGKIGKTENNFYIALNPGVVTINKEKLKHLELKRFLT